jgi:hypothetical protein
MKELLNVSTKQGETLVLTTENMDKKIHEPERHFCFPDINNESLQGNKRNASPLSTVKSTGTPSQNELGDECLFQAEGGIETQHDVSGKESNKTVCCKRTESGNYVLIARENLSTVLGDEVQSVCSALSGKESMEIISDTHDSILMTRRITNPLLENKCSVQPEIESESADSNFNGQEFLLQESKVKKNKRTVLGNSSERNVSFSPGNAKVKSENLMTISRDVTKSGNVHLTGKEITKISETGDSLLTVKESTNSVAVTSSSVQLNINNRCAKLNYSGQKAAVLCNIREKETFITDTHHSFLTVSSIANSESEESCLGQNEIESEDAESSDHGQEPLPSKKKIRKDKIRALDDSVVKEVLFSPKNVKVNSEKLSTVSSDKIEEVDTHLTGVVNNQISYPHDSFLTRKQCTNSVSKKSCSVHLKIGSKDAKSNGYGQKPASLSSKLEGSERTFPDISTEKETSIPSENMKVKSKSVRKKSEGQPEDVDACVSGKRGKEMITDTHHSLLTVRSVTNSESEKSCMGQKEIERKAAKSRKLAAKEISVPFKNVKIGSQNLRTISGEKMEKVGGIVFRKKKKKRISNTRDYFLRERRNTNSLSKKRHFVEPETESKYAQLNYKGKEPVCPQLKLKDTKRAVLDKRTEIFQEIKNKGINDVILESKCEEEHSVDADHSATKEADVMPPYSKKIIQLTEEVI